MGGLSHLNQGTDNKLDENEWDVIVASTPSLRGAGLQAKIEAFMRSIDDGEKNQGKTK